MDKTTCGLPCYAFKHTAPCCTLLVLPLVSTLTHTKLHYTPACGRGKTALHCTRLQLLPFHLAPSMHGAPLRTSSGLLPHAFYLACFFVYNACGTTIHLPRTRTAYSPRAALPRCPPPPRTHTAAHRFHRCALHAHAPRTPWTLPAGTPPPDQLSLVADALPVFF